MHAKTDSDVSHVTSTGTLSPPRSPTRRAVYYVESPSFSNQDLDKLSYDGTFSPNASPTRHYHCSPVHHSRESSTSRLFSSSNLKLHYHRAGGWRRIYGGRRLDYCDRNDGVDEEVGDDDGGDDVGGYNDGPSLRFYVGCFLVSFFVLFTAFSLILWGASKAFHPHILVKNMVFLDFTIQAGMDDTGVPTDMLSLNSTVKIYYKNPATFFGVHVTSTPLELYYYNLKVASGQMKKFYQKRKSQSKKTTVVKGRQIPLYGAMSVVSNAREGNSLHTEKAKVGLNLTFTVRSRAYILGRLVKSKFYTRIRCPVTLHGTHLGKPTNLLHSCVYE